jgi:ribA/ribD-fused uncharacterized protein
VTARVITQFAGACRCLSNFYQSPVSIEGLVYPSAEHAFQAMKTTNAAARRSIAMARTPAEAKGLGRTVPLVDGWNECGRYDAMEKVIAAKFAPNTVLAASLVATGGAILIEGNKWHDNTWGICYCGVCRNGHNLLGWILMRQRAKLNQTRFSVYA